MGGCASKSAVYEAPVKGPQHQQQADHQLTTKDAAHAAEAAGTGAAELSPSPNLDVKQVKELLHLMQEPHDYPAAHLSRVAEALRAALGVDTVSITACVGATSAYVTQAAAGRGTDLLPRDTVMRGPDWSPALLTSGVTRLVLEASRGDSAAASIAGVGGEASRRTSAASLRNLRVGRGGRPLLPQDWALLARQAGLASFCAVPIARPGEDLLGVLAVASTRQGAFEEEDRWEASLSMAAIGLAPLLRQPLAAASAALLAYLDAAPSPPVLILRLLAGVGGLMAGTLAAPLLQGFSLAPSSVAAAGVAAAAGGGAGGGGYVGGGGLGGSGLGVRLALLDDTEAEEGSVQQLVWELGHGGGAGEGHHAATERLEGWGAASLCGSDVSALGAVRELRLAITPLPLEGSLLQQALGLRRARLVSDVPRYLQSNLTPAHDIFLGSPTPVASIVVLPLMRRGQPLGALILTAAEPTDFAVVKGALRHLVNFLGPLLCRRLGDQLAAVAAAARTKRSPQASPGSVMSHKVRSLTSVAEDAVVAVAGGSSSPSSMSSGSASSVALTSVSRAQGPGSSASSSPLARGSSGWTSSSLALTGVGAVPAALMAKRSSHSALLELMREEVGRARAAVAAQEAAGGWLSELVLHAVLGRGGYGTVYRATWRGAPAAVKVLHARVGERAALKDALEMALLGGLSHPHITTLYAALPDMVEEAGGGADLATLLNSGRLTGSLPRAQEPSTPSGAGAAAPEGISPASSLIGVEHQHSSTSSGRLASFHTPAVLPLRYRHLLPGDEECGVTSCCLMVMELCDGGSLRRALGAGLVHRPSSSREGAVAVDMWALLQVLVQLAQALRYLHTAQLLHCDVKADNVLLRSDPAQPLGWSVKLSDFGVSKLLREGGAVINRSCSGTLSHLAPELFQVGARLTPAIDTYSFAILMWEAFTGQRAFANLPRASLPRHITKAGGRPAWPSATPPAYQQLAIECWAADPSQRPGFDQIVKRLTAMLVEEERRAGERLRKVKVKRSDSSMSLG